MIYHISVLYDQFHFFGFYGEDLKSCIVVFASTIFLILHMKPNKIKIAFKFRRINFGKVKFSFNFDLRGLSENYYCVFLSYMQIFVDVVIFLVVGDSAEKVLLVRASFFFSFFLSFPNLWLQNICNFFEFFQSFFFFQFTLLGPPGAGNCTWGRVP